MPTLQVPAPLNTVGIAKLSETRGQFLSLPLINRVNREEAQVQWTLAGVASSDFKSVLEMKTKSFIFGIANTQPCASFVKVRKTT